MTVDQTVAPPATQKAVEPVGIAYGQDGDARVALQGAATRIAHGLLAGHVVDLENGGLERGDAGEHGARARVDAVETQAQAAEVHLIFGEMLDAGRVADMTQDMVGEAGLKGVGAQSEAAELLAREVVEAVAVAAHEMGKDAARQQGRLAREAGDKLRHILQRVEAQTVHARVELDVDGEIGDAVALRRIDEGVEQTEGIDLGLELIPEERVETRHLGIHHHDARSDARTAQRGTLVGDGNGQIGNALILKRLGHLDGAGTVGVGLDHADDRRAPDAVALGHTEEGAVVVEILNDGGQVDLKHRLVDLLHEGGRDALEAVAAGALDEDDAVMKRGAQTAGEEVLGGGEADDLEVLVALHLREHGADTDEDVDAVGLEGTAHGSGHLAGRHARLLHVGEDEHAGDAARLGTAVEKIERRVERLQVVAVAVVDEDAAVAARHHLHAHRHAADVLRTRLDGLLVHTQIAAHAGAECEVGIIRRAVETVTDEENLFGTGEELELLLPFLLVAAEILLMRLAQTREDADGGADDVVQGLHLAGLGDAGLDDGNLRALVNAPDGQRHTNLRVVAARRARHNVVGREHLVEKLLDGGLAVAARDADDGDVETAPMAGCHTLQGLKAVTHIDKRDRRVGIAD